MGSRAQVKIQDTGVFLYTHWGSREIVEDVRKVIKRGKRLSDPEYLARIIFDQMKKTDVGDLGFGIGTSQHGDIEVLVTIDTEKQTVTVADIREKTSVTQTFKEFA